ncbi:MAG: lipoprotein [Oscillibacter sp.]
MSLLLALALVFSLAACGSKTDDTNHGRHKGDANAGALISSSSPPPP